MIDRAAMRRQLFRAALAVAALCLGESASAQHVLDQDTVKEQLASRLGVEVLDIQPAELDGDQVYIVTVMRAGGNSNAAFEVSRIAIDAGTGGLLPPIRMQAAGYLPPDPGRWVPNSNADGRIVRQRTFRD